MNWLCTSYSYDKIRYIMYKDRVARRKNCLESGIDRFVFKNTYYVDFV